MRDRIKAAAEKSGRSMNAEIIHRLEMTFGFLEIDHIRPISEGGTSDLSNLRFVTPSEHRLIHVLERLEKRLAEETGERVKEQAPLPKDAD
ncbi:HNH endonuclease signature motif containing protein [Celeribacter sp.]